MKTTLNLIALSVIVLLSACSTSDKFSAMKRKYKPGYYVEFGGNKKAPSAVNIGSQSQSSTNKAASSKEMAAVAETIINTEKEAEKKYPLTASNDNKVNSSSIELQEQSENNNFKYNGFGYKKTNSCKTIETAKSNTF